MEFTVTGENLAAERIQLIGARGTNLAPVMELIKQIIMEGHAKQFESKGGYLGTPWPALATSTVVRKEEQGLPSDTLEATGALRTALMGGTGRKTSVTRTLVRVGLAKSVAWYGLFAARGTKREPARPITGMTPTSSEEALGMIQRYVTEGV